MFEQQKNVNGYTAGNIIEKHCQHPEHHPSYEYNKVKFSYESDKIDKTLFTFASAYRQHIKLFCGLSVYKNKIIFNKVIFV